MQTQFYNDTPENHNLIAFLNTSVTTQFEYKIFQKNDFVIRPETNNDFVYLIKTGRVKIGAQFDYDKEIIKDILTEGEFFGNIPSIGLISKLGFAMAMETTEVIAIPSKKLETLMLNHPELTLFIMRSLSSRLIDMEQRIESIVFKDSRSRIIEFIKKFVNKFGKRVGYEIVIWKVLTHQEIANYTATSRQTVTTVLNELRNKNILTFNRKRLLIRDYDLLNQEAA